MPMLSAVSSSARQLFLLLRCISFSSRAQVQLSPEGIRFSVEDSQAMQGLAFLDKALFTTFRFNPAGSTDPDGNADDFDLTTFQISLSALLETLQILGFSDTKDYGSSRDGAFSNLMNDPLARGGGNAAFDSRVLGMSSICRFIYEGPGSPLSITLEEGNVTTTCNLVTYEPYSLEDIPFDRNRLAQKIVMRASCLHDAITELSSNSPERLVMISSPKAPFLSLSTSGALGSATVEFSKESQILDTFQVPRRTTNSYHFSLIRAALKAMAVAAKVSIRGDDQGVLSLQFLIEVDGGGVCFVDFRFVPLLADEEDENDGDAGGRSSIGPESQ